LLGRIKNLWARSEDKDVPPVRLRKRVHGAEDLDSFLAVGDSVSRTVFECLPRQVDPNAAVRGLDFGAGCGRVLAPLSKLCQADPAVGKVKWYGSDIDREAIAWCQKHLPETGAFVVNDPMPPLPFPDQFFDFVFSISVVTHIPEDMQFAWLADLRRVSKVGGRVLLSTLPIGLVADKLTGDEIAYGFYYAGGGKGTKGLPKFYQDSFHSRAYIEREWSRYFSIERFAEKGIAGHQDLVLCRRAE